MPMNRSIFQVFALLLVFLFGILLLTVICLHPTRPTEIFLFFLLTSGAIGLVFWKEWGRRLIQVASIAGIGYFVVKQIELLHQFDISSTAMMGICALVLYFYRGHSLESLFETNKSIPTPSLGWTVLVVDDDLTFVKLVRSHFVKKGLNVISSESGERGVEMAKRWKPDLIILDVILPGIKGRTVCSQLKEDPDTQDIPVMFVTFKNSLDDISAEMELGAVMHLTKPVNYDYLYQQVMKILGKK